MNGRRTAACAGVEDEEAEPAGSGAAGPSNSPMPSLPDIAALMEDPEFASLKEDPEIADIIAEARRDRTSLMRHMSNPKFVRLVSAAMKRLGTSR